ncbi:50S ribosomal protein L5 [Candidatus Peregrinibacteria bacterium]|nr:50S ribosomal protein L5 [Candidatus Peregrinibacteria bacterium]
MSFFETYKAKISKELQKELAVKNRLAVPRMLKIVVNAGIGKYLAGGEKKDSPKVVDAMKLITGQSPIVNKSRVSISNFKLKAGATVGVSATLRGKRMYDFFERVVTYVAPRIRDFRGFPGKSFDGRGNYSFGIKEHTVFPEISQDDVVRPFGLQITIATNTKTDADARKLLEKFNFPFSK